MSTAASKITVHQPGEDGLQRIDVVYHPTPAVSYTYHVKPALVTAVIHAYENEWSVGMAISAVKDASKTCIKSAST